MLNEPDYFRVDNEAGTFTDAPYPGFHRFYLDAQDALKELERQLETERTERQGELDTLTSRLLSEIAEIRSAQSVDGCEIASAQADISRLEQQLEDFENTFEPAPSPAVQWVRAIGFAVIGAALALGAITASDYVTLSLPAQPVPTVGSK